MKIGRFFEGDGCWLAAAPLTRTEDSRELGLQELVMIMAMDIAVDFGVDGKVKARSKMKVVEKSCRAVAKPHAV